jgi:hypothetical protein
MRKVDTCINCREIRDLVAHGLCGTCYKADVRAKQRADEQAILKPDLWNPAVGKGQVELAKGFAMMLSMFRTIHVSKTDAEKIRAILYPYFEPIRCYVNKPETQSVDSGQDSTLSTVYSIKAVEKPKK